jgi:integrase
MSLRIVSRPGRSVLYVRGTVRGQSVFESAGTDDPKRAEAYRAKREAELWDASVYGARAVVTFSTAAQSYLTAEPRTEGTKAFVRKLALHFRTMPLGKIKQPELDQAYVALLAPGASPATKLRNVLTPLRAILEHAARRDWCDRPAFEVPRQPRPRVAFLRPDQATALVEAAAPHLRPLIVFLIGTAARMSEALELDWQDVDLAASRATFRETKTDRERWVDLVPAVRAALAALPHRDGRVFRPAYPRRRGPDEHGQQWVIGDAYRDSGRQGGGQVKTAWAGACRRAAITGLTMHDLRHTAATWHYAMHRDLLLLQQFGGWSSLAQVQVYAHLLPDVHVKAVRGWLGLADPARTRNAHA